jgi:hypothetical protein
MGNIRHSLCCHPWQSSTDSGATLPLTILWAALCSLGFCFLQGELNQFFSDTGDICRCLCRRPLLLVAHSEAMCLLSTPYVVPHMRDMQKFMLWGLLWAWKTTHRKNSRHLTRPLPASIAVRHSFRCDKHACHIVGDAGHARFCQTCNEG